jgi:phosphatidate cytidylyltransferase
MSKKMMTKIMTALILVAAVLPPFLLGGWLLEALIFVISALAAYEIASLEDQKPHWAMTIFVLAAVEALCHLQLNAFPAATAMFLIVLFVVHYADEHYSMDEAAYTFLITMIISMAWRGVYQIYTHHLGGLGMLYVGFACFLCDTGAYFFGVFFGKHKMIPRVSPNKTWEGAVGGYALGFLSSFLLGWFAIPAMPKGLLIVSSLILPAVAEIGDLAFSSIKRRFGIKDFGSLLPGHGGVLDRIDSFLFCLMVFNGLMLIWGL